MRNANLSAAFLAATLVLTSVLSPSLAGANAPGSCETNLLGQASWAQRILSRFSGSVYEYSAGMSVPRKVRILREMNADGTQSDAPAVHFRKSAEGTRKTASYKLVINENVRATRPRTLDIASIYIRTGTSTFTSLARMVDCPANTVGFLTFDVGFAPIQ